MFIARSLVFYPGYYEDNCQELSDEIILPSFYLNKLMDQFEDNEILYVDMINTETDETILVAIGKPHNYDKNTIFASHWILDQIGCSGNCDSVIKIKKSNMSDIPIATKITIKPLDPIAFEIDTLKCFETAFMNLHSIKEGITIQIPVPELGKDYVMFAHIEKVEPAPISRIIEGEVDVEFINEFKKMNHMLDNNIDNNTIDNNTIDNNTNDNKNDYEVPIIDQEERRRRIRESWIRRFDNTSC
jgi:hypothetical protein